MTYEKAIEMLKERKFGAAIRGHEETAEMCEMAIEALEKQMPKKPKVETFSYVYLDDYFGRQYFCPNCNRLLINEDMHGFFSGRKQQYCDVCGQAIDWGVSE